MTDIYTTCPDCSHTTLIHNESGCHAYKCDCKKEYR